MYVLNPQGGNPGLTVVIQGQGQTQGQLQIIPQGVTVIPGPGQQLMQAAMPNGQVQRFLFTPLPPSQAASTPTTQTPTQTPTKPALTQISSSQGPALVKTTPSAFAQTQMTAPLPASKHVAGQASAPLDPPQPLPPMHTQITATVPTQSQIPTPVPAVQTSAPATAPSQLPVATPAIGLVPTQAAAAIQNQVSTNTVALPAQASAVAAAPTSVSAQVVPPTQPQPNSLHPVSGFTSTPVQTHLTTPTPALTTSLTPALTHALAPALGPMTTALVAPSASVPPSIEAPTPALAPVSATLMAVVSNHVAVPSAARPLTKFQTAAPVLPHATAAVVTPVSATSTTPSVPGKDVSIASSLSHSHINIFLHACVDRERILKFLKFFFFVQGQHFVDFFGPIYV